MTDPREKDRQVFRRVPSPRWPTVPLAAALLVLACHPGVDPPGVPLYPNGATTRLPREQIAHVVGPVGKIDYRAVEDQGGSFDLLPGCHVVELDRRMTNESYALTGAAYVTGQFPMTVYAIQMKAGARYIIQRDVPSSEMGPIVRISLSAREEDANGRVTELSPTTSSEVIRNCK
jgi:hypothetical protein